MDLKKKLRDHSLITAMLFALLVLWQMVYIFSMLAGYPIGLLMNYSGLSQPLWFLAYALIAASVLMERKDTLTMVGFGAPAMLSLLSLFFTEQSRLLAGFSLLINGVMFFLVAASGMKCLSGYRDRTKKIWFLPAALQGIYWIAAAYIYPAVTGVRIGSPVYLLQAAALLFAGMWAAELDTEKIFGRKTEKTLYVSDLDGTLLRSDETISEYTAQTINALAERGMLFSFATARSRITARKVTEGIQVQIPMIVYNGVFVMDSATGETLLSNFFGEEGDALLRDLLDREVYPIVYSFREGEEKFSYIPEKCSKGMQTFLDTRKGDPREHPVAETGELFDGEKFYFACIDEPEKLEPLYEKYGQQFHCVYHQDIYSGEQWLEFMPKSASKANAICRLKEHLKCDRVVVFGDGKNDVDMFQQADEAYAVENAVEELKQIATGIIGSNNEDGVARWLMENYV